MTSALYALNSAIEPRDVIPFGQWLLDSCRNDGSVSVVLREETLAFGSPTSVWTFPLGNEPVMEVLLAVLRANVIDLPQVSFVARDLFVDLVALCQALAPLLGISERQAYLSLAPVFDGDLTSAARVLGHKPESHEDYAAIEDDAYAIAVHEKQFSLGAPKYYEAISLPFAKLQAEGKLSGQAKASWWVSYENLWLRVLAHMTGDPLFLGALREDHSVIAVVMRSLECDAEAAQALLIWQVYGRDVDAMVRHLPEIVDKLPSELPSWGLRLDRKFPALCASLSAMQSSYWQNRGANTLYGRRLRPGQTLGEATAWMVFGTVEDIIANAAVTLWKNRTSPDIIITLISGGPAAPVLRVGGTGGGAQWSYMAKELAPLGNPLKTVPLRPTYVEA